MYTWLVELAECFDALNNFSGVVAILSGLQQPSVTRLAQTIAIVPSSTKDTFKRLQLVMAVNKNYAAYRVEMAKRVERLTSDETESEEADLKKTQIE